MKSAMWRGTTLLLALALAATEVSLQEYERPDYKLSPHSDKGIPELVSHGATVSDEEYIRHIHSIFDAYRGELGGRMVIETNALIDTKYRTWKRNADLINSILALPKGMNDAGRR